MGEHENKPIRRSENTHRRADVRNWKVYDATVARISRFQQWILKHRVLSAIYAFVTRLFHDNIVGIAAQTAFFLLLAIFPIVMLVATWLSQLPLNFDASALGTVLPQSVVEILMPVIENAPSSAGFTVIQIVLAVWSASAGIWALMRGICISHTGSLPNFFKGRLISMLLMVGFMLMLALSIAVWVFGHDIVALVAGSDWIASDLTVRVARYAFTLPLLFLFVLIVYMATPGFEVKKRHMVFGALFAASGWTLVSWGFEKYMTAFSNYSVLYGGVGAFIGLAVWLMVICFVILLGAELNALIVEISSFHRERKLRSADSSDM